MRKKEKAAAIIKLLKKGMTPIEITKRIGVSYNYAWKLKKDLEEAVEDAKTTTLEVSSDFLESLSRGKGKPKPEPKPEPEVTAKAGEFIEVEGAKNAQEIDAILGKRGEQYGSFMQSSDTVIRIKGIMHNAVARNAVHLYPDQLQALDMIATKLSRIVHGNPNHLDSWIDIAGYATLVADRLQGKIR
jgi:hypothetical protein